MKQKQEQSNETIKNFSGFLLLGTTAVLTGITMIAHLPVSFIGESIDYIGSKLSKNPEKKYQGNFLNNTLGNSYILGLLVGFHLPAIPIGIYQYVKNKVGKKSSEAQPAEVQLTASSEQEGQRVEPAHGVAPRSRTVPYVNRETRERKKIPVDSVAELLDKAYRAGKTVIVQPISSEHFTKLGKQAGQALTQEEMNQLLDNARQDYSPLIKKPRV